MIWPYNFESTAYHHFVNWHNISFLPFVVKHSFSKLCLTSKNKGFDIKEAHSFNMPMEIPSCPLALFGSKDLIILIISSLEISFLYSQKLSH